MQGEPQPQSSPKRWILYGPDRVPSSCPFDVSRTSPSLNSSSIASWTAGIALRQSCAIKRATSLGHIVAPGARRSCRADVAAFGSVIQTESGPYANRSSSVCH